ncbi:hypothetical protein FSP39_019053 [Pinctada imbricata]|uniref:Centromere protein S n=1 Tax=Pinctada imbricata TaxID=66713 RepID=A0AA89BNW4_PINIB|nr:hypothetical protein FSP39_019053 [Pinctada imbricata]
MAFDNTESIEQLQYKQKLKAAVYYSTMKISEQSIEQEEVTLGRQAIAGIAETVWKQCQQMATDLESFAKHGKRTTVTVDDVKLLVRNSPTLLPHLSEMHEKQTEGKQQAKKQRKPSKKKSTTSTSAAMETDEDSNMV